jgi:hypothetical protein
MVTQMKPDSEIGKLLRAALIDHIENHNGLVTAPEKLLARQITALAAWLKENINEYEEHGMYDEAAALKDIVSRL